MLIVIDSKNCINGATNLESVEITSCRFIVNGNDDRLDEEIEFSSALDAIRIGAGRVVAAGQDRQRRIGANGIGEIVEECLECR